MAVVMKLIDIHCHLDLPEFADDLPELIKKCEDAGVVAIITNGTDRISNRNVLEIAKKYPIVRAALGIYPMDALRREKLALKMDPKDIDINVDEELEFIKSHREEIVALGEVGLDFVNSNAEEQKQQKELFLKFIELSERIKKPMIVHSRKAEREVIEMLESSRLKNAVLHCFCGKKSLVNKAIDMDYYFSIPANIERAENFQANVKRVSINRLFTETDAPWLSPTKGERNDSSNVAVTVRKIAELKQMTEEEVANNIFFNYQRLFL